MKKNFLKKSIALSIVPVFVLAGCSSNEDQARLAVPNGDSEVAMNADGSYSQPADLNPNAEDAAPANDANAEQTANDQKLLDSYKQAQDNGYTGSLDDWVALSKLHETNPEQAQAQAEESGFSGGEMLMGALAGAAIGALLASSSGSRSGLASNTYSAQRTNNANNYAYSRPKEEERRSGGSTYAGSSGGAAAAAAANNARSVNSTPTTKPSSTSSYSANNNSNSSYSSSRATASYGSVSRGGFGGAVSSGG